VAYQKDVIEFIEAAFGSGVLSNGGLNISVVCPICAAAKDNLHKKKLVIRTDDFLTHCWVCGYRSTNLTELLSTYHPALLGEYKKKFRIIPKAEKALSIEDIISSMGEMKEKRSQLATQLTLPEGFRMLAPNLTQNDSLIKRAWSYLRARGLTEADLWRWKIGITTHTPTDRKKDFRYRVIFPSFDSEGKLNFFSARAFLPGWKGPPYSNPEMKRESIVFNELNIDWSRELTLVEGVFDLVNCNDNATCILGSSLDSSYKLFQEIARNETPVLLALDPDAKVKALKIGRSLLEYGVSVRMLELPIGVKDVGELNRLQFTDLARDAKVLRLEDYFHMKLGE
jgi:hypothetical protein